VGGLLEIIVALAGIGTAVALFAVLKKQNEELALGLVASRTLEAATIFVGVAFILSIVTLRKAGVGSGGLVTSHALVALYNRIFLLGQSFMPAINDALLGFMLYQSRLVPRALSRIGLIGSPILIIGYLLVLFDAIGQRSSLLPRLSPRTDRPQPQLKSRHSQLCGWRLFRCSGEQTASDLLGRVPWIMGRDRVARY
jgi:hypothetical protein